MATFNVSAALKAGYSQDQINGYIQQNKLTPINVPTTTPTQTPVAPTVTPQVTTQPSSDLATGLGQGALNFLSNLVKPFVDTAKTIGGAGFENMRIPILNNATDTLNKNTQAQLDVIQKLKKETDPTKKLQLLKQAQDLSNQGDQAKQVVQQASVQDPFLNNQELQRASNPQTAAIDTAKRTAGILSYAVPFGEAAPGAEAAAQIANPLLRTIAGLATKYTLPGAVAGGLQGASQDNATPASVVGNSILGAGGATVLGPIGSLFGKVAGGVGDATQAAGNKFIRSQYNVPAAEKTYLDLGNTVNKLADYGFKNINDVAKVAPQITGDNGIITQLTRQAVAKSSPVNVGGILDYAKGLIDNEPLINQTAGRKFLNVITKGISSSTGDKVGGGDPIATFDFIQNLESKASSLAKGNAGDEARSLAGVYKNVANELKTRLFEGSPTELPNVSKLVVDPKTGEFIAAPSTQQVISGGANNALVNDILTPDVLSQIEKISPKLAREVSQVKTLGELRSLAAPFVRGSKLANITTSRENNAIITGKDIGAGIAGGLAGGGPGAIATYIAEKALQSNAGKSIVGGTLKQIGKNASGVSGNLEAANPVLQKILGLAGAVGASNLSVAEKNSNNNKNSSEQQTSNNLSNHATSIPQDNANVNYGSNSNSGIKITPQQVAAAQLMLPPMIADRIKAAYQAQFGGLSPADIQQQQGLLKETQRISSMIDQLQPDQPKVAASNLLGIFGKGDAGVQQLQAEAASLNQDLVTTLHRRGMSPEQMKSMDALLLQPGKDSVQQMQAKIKGINNLLQNFYPYSAGSDASTVDTTGGQQ